MHDGGQKGGCNPKLEGPFLVSGLDFILKVDKVGKEKLVHHNKL